MPSVKSIAIVDATTETGSAIARRLSKTNCHLLLMSKVREKLATLKSEIDKSSKGSTSEAVSCAMEACWEADIIIVASPYGTERAIAEKIRQVSTGKLVIWIGDPCGQRTELVDSGDANAINDPQSLLPNSKVVRAFDSAIAALLATT